MRREMSESEAYQEFLSSGYIVSHGKVMKTPARWAWEKIPIGITFRDIPGFDPSRDLPRLGLGKDGLPTKKDDAAYRRHKEAIEAIRARRSRDKD